MNNIVTKEQLLQKIDDFEEKIELINKLNKEYDNLKSEIKSIMVQIGRENDLEQIKWTTNKGTKITCSIGKEAEFEKRKVKEFNEAFLKENYPEIYDKCFIEREREIKIKNATNDTLRITLNKEGEKDE